jgi:CheY-like chemotaxis protein
MANSRSHILLVDDSVDILNAMVFFLEASGFSVNTAENGRLALDKLRSGAPLPDVIILDMMMPVMDGLSFRQEQLKDERIAQIPVILVTALSQAALKDIGNTSFQRVLNKPIEADELVVALQQMTQ